MTNRFDQGAASWDAKEYRIRLANNVAKAISNQVQMNPDMDLMDFGCGTGLVSLQFAPDVATLTGVDNSVGMLEVFTDKAKALNLDNVSSLNINLGEGGILTGLYDLILSSMTFHHVENVPALIETLYKSLKPGGYLCVADLDPDHGFFHSDNTGIHHFGFDRDVMIGFFQRAGLKNVTASTAAIMPRVGDDGVEREFTIFLVTGSKS